MLTERDLVETHDCECPHCDCFWEEDDECCICGELSAEAELDDFDYWASDDEDFFSDLLEDDAEDFD